MTDILALDLATITGFARGKLGEIPVCGSLNFGGRDASGLSDSVFWVALRMLERLIGENPPQIMIVESMLPPDAMKSKTSRAVRDRLAGLHGIARAVAFKHGVGEITEASVGNVRAHFIGQCNLARKDAKAAVLQRCRALGWQVANDNESDAAALWSYACGLLDPKAALMVMPLFNPKLKVTVWP